MNNDTAPYGLVGKWMRRGKDFPVEHFVIECFNGYNGRKTLKTACERSMNPIRALPGEKGEWHRCVACEDALRKMKEAEKKHGQEIGRDVVR